MTTWTHLHAPELDAAASLKIRKRAGVLARQVDELLSARADFDREAGELLATDATEGDPGALAPSFRRRQVEILQSEIRVRRQLADLDGAYRAELSTIATAAGDHYRAEQLRIRGLLVSIGYRDVDVHRGEIGTITNGMVASHPDVHQAKVRADTLRAAVRCTSFASQNDEAMEQVITALEKIRGRAVSAACL